MNPTPNERFIYPSCPNGGAVPCYCLACAPETTRLHRAEAAARAPETASDYLARVSDAAVAYAIEAERLRTFLKDCGCPCCSARARLRTLREDSYNRACESPASIHCASTDRRDDNEDPAVAARLLAIDKACLDETDRRLALLRDSDEERQAVRAAAEGYHETDTNAR